MLHNYYKNILMTKRLSTFKVLHVSVYISVFKLLDFFIIAAGVLLFLSFYLDRLLLQVAVFSF